MLAVTLVAVLVGRTVLYVSTELLLARRVPSGPKICTGSSLSDPPHRSNVGPARIGHLPAEPSHDERGDRGWPRRVLECKRSKVLNKYRTKR